MAFVLSVLSGLLLSLLFKTMDIHVQSESVRGRKIHNFYEELDFLHKKQDNGRTAAQCVYCNVLLKNTSISRLRTHRKRCILESTHDSTDESEDVSCHVLSDDDIEYVNDEIEHVNVNQSVEHGTVRENVLLELEQQQDVGPNLSNCEIMDKDSLENFFLETSTPNSLVETEEYEDHGYCKPSTSSSSSGSILSLQPRPALEININKKRKNYATKKKSKSNNKITSYVDTMPSDLKDEVDLALAKFFFGCNIPFSVVESDQFKNFIKIIRPSYVPPCRKTLGSTLLDRVNDEMIQTNKKMLSSTMTSLVIDGWKNSSNNTKNVVTMLQCVGGQSLFLQSYDFSNTRETGDALANICERSVELAQIKYGCNVYAVVSDNASNMMRMGRTTNLWHSTCSSHTGNLLAKDIVCQQLMGKLVTVLKEFKHTDLENSLVKNGGSRIILPSDTRWCSYRDSCKCFCNNVAVMKRIMAESSVKLKSDVMYLLYDENFFNEINNTINLLDPICELINKCQQINFSIADAAEEWLGLIDKIPENLQSEQIKIAISHRVKMGTNIYSLAANYLNPMYRGRRLDDSQITAVQEFLLDMLDNQGLDGLHTFDKSTDVFQKLFDKNVTSPNTFWGFAEKKYPSLALLAQKLLKIPASSAQLERIFSNWSFVHSTLRNRLTQDRSAKLIFVYYSLKLSDSNKSEQY